MTPPPGSTVAPPAPSARTGRRGGDGAASAAGRAPTNPDWSSWATAPTPQECVDTATSGPANRSFEDMSFEDMSSEPAPVSESLFPLDVSGYRNDELNRESLAVDEWYAANALVSPPHPDQDQYRDYRRRLRAERTARVAAGHLWLTVALPTPPRILYLLTTDRGLTHIVSADLATVLGVPDQSFPGPIMTEEQFAVHAGRLGVEVLNPREYQARMEAAAVALGQAWWGMDPGRRGGALGTGPGGDDRYRGYLGGVAMLDGRAVAIANALPYQNVNVRAGDIGEAFALHGRDAVGGRDYNTGGRRWTGDWLRPFRPGRGNVPVADIRLGPWRTQPDIRDASVKVLRPGTKASTSPSGRSRYQTFLRGMADISDTSSTKFQRFAAEHRPGMALDDVRSGLVLQVPDEHLDGFRNLLSDATGYDLSDRGNRASRPNYDLAPFRVIYRNTPLDPPIRLSDGSIASTGGDLYDARQRIPPAEFEAGLRRVGAAAAARVRGFGGGQVSRAIGFYESFLGHQPTRRATDIRARVNVETVQALERIRADHAEFDPAAVERGDYRRATAAAGHTNAVRGTAAQTIFGSSVHVLSGGDIDQRFVEDTAAGAAVSYGSEFGESVLRARLGTSTATGTRLVLGRAGARALGPAADVVMDIYDMVRDNRDNSAAEVVIRTGRAAVIGTGAAYAGAAVGTLIGGPIGFVVGFGVGAAVGWLANRILPGGGDDWRRRHEADQRRRAELAARLERQRQLQAKLEARRRRLATPLSTDRAAVAGLEAGFDLGSTNPLFNESRPDVEPTVGDLEAEFLAAYVRGLTGSPR
ncbi:MAG: hypothetical protein ACK5PP_19805 [Acidimicrobiales bacterium]